MESDSGVTLMRRETRKSFILTTIGVFLTFSAHYALRNLQSSLNIEDGLGTTSLSVMEGAAIFCGLFLAPVALAYVNVRYGVMLSDVTLLTYVLANFYPAYSTLIPSSVLAGFGKTLFWICINRINIHFARRLELCGTRDYSTYVSKVSSYFFGALMATQLFGNLIPFISFELAASTLSNDLPITNSVTTISMNASTAGTRDIDFVDFQHCAANDCQDASITANSSNYKPANEESLNLVIGIFAGMTLAALVLHWRFVPSIDEDQGTPVRNKIPQSNPSFVIDELSERPQSKKSEFLNGRQTAISSIEMALDHNGNIADQNNNNNSGKHKPNIPASKSSSSVSILKEVTTELIKTWKFFFIPKQLLLFWSQVMMGLNVAFSTSEITRAYVSCVFGVAEVGICMAIYGTLALISSFVSGRVVSLCGRGYPTALAFLINYGIYFFCLFWRPDEFSSVGIVYGLLSFCGVVDGIYQTMSIIAVAVIFPCDTKLAYTWWAVNTTIGYLITYAWSTALCVHDKIYAQAGMLAVTIVTYALTEYVHLKESDNEKKSQRDLNIAANRETKDKRSPAEI